MAELIYSQGPVRLIGTLLAGRPSEMLPVVEPSGEVVARASRCECHSSNLLHPVVHLHIIDRYSRIYLQHRSPTKDFLPDMWDTAVGGHVSFGEAAEEALFREASEELGLYDFNPVQIRDYIFNGDTERELVFVYAAVGSFELKPDNFEVSEGRWWTVEEIEAGLGKGVLTPQFESEFKMIKSSLLALL